jgi:transposase-like protein
LLAERGFTVDHSTIWRWVQRFAPEVLFRLCPHLKPTNRSWRVDETYVRVKGRWCYLYRAIDSRGATIEFFLSASRDLDAAKSLFRRGLRNGAHPQPRVINMDLAPTYTSAIPALQRTGVIGQRCRHRPAQYLNNIIEQDHRALKKRVNAKQGFRTFAAARRTVEGYDAMHMMKKGQVRWIAGDDLRRQLQFVDKLFGLTD